MAVPRGLQLFARSEVVGLQHRLDAAVESLNHADGPLANAWAAGEIMVGALHGQGDLAGFGMTIGTVFGRIAGREAAAFLR